MSVIYFCPEFICCPYYRGVRYRGVSARRELTVLVLQVWTLKAVIYNYFTIIIVFNHVIHSCLQASFILYYNTNYCVDWSISNLVYEERTTSLGTEPASLSPQEKSEKGPLTEGSLGVVWLLSLKCNVCLSLSLKWEKWQNSDKHCKSQAAQT